MNKTYKDIDQRVKVLGQDERQSNMQRAFIDYADTMDNAKLIADVYLPNATAADIIQLADLMVKREIEISKNNFRISSLIEELDNE